MKLYLSRRLNGLYQLTRLEPVICNIIGTDYRDAFPQPGDPINVQGLCPFSVKKLFGSELDICAVSRVSIICEDITKKRQLEDAINAGDVTR